MAETLTPNFALSKFDQGDLPPVLTAAKLNANWTKIDARLVARVAGLTPVGNVGGGEDNLIQLTLPANSLRQTGSFVRYTAWGTIANNANAKTLKVYFGGQLVANISLTANIADVWKVVVEIFRTGASTQAYVAVTLYHGAAGLALIDSEQGTGAENDAADMIVKCTGTGTSDNDIVQKGGILEIMP